MPQSQNNGVKLVSNLLASSLSEAIRNTPTLVLVKRLKSLEKLARCSRTAECQITHLRTIIEGRASVRATQMGIESIHAI